MRYRHASIAILSKMVECFALTISSVSVSMSIQVKSGGDADGKDAFDVHLDFLVAAIHSSCTASDSNHLQNAFAGSKTFSNRSVNPLKRQGEAVPSGPKRRK